SLYSAAYQLTKEPRYKEVVYQSITWLEREMSDANGGFYSSLDADSEGEEGKFYVWTETELDSLLGEDARLFKAFYEVVPKGNWEHSNILHHTKTKKDFAKKYEIEIIELEALLQRTHAKLLSVRQERIAPGLDDKILTSWNALMLKGYVDAYRVFGEADFLDRALRNARFLQQKMQRPDGGLYRNHKDGKSSINAFADDYGLLIEAYVSLYQATFDEEWLFEAEGLMEYCLAHFYHEKSGLFYYTSDEDNPLIARSRELPDNVIAGSNSILAKDLFLLGTYLYKEDYLDKAERMLLHVIDNARADGAFYGNWGILLNWIVNTPYEVAIVGEDFAKVRQELDQQYLPNVFLLGGVDEGKLELLEYKKVPGATMIYVCQNKVCQMPTEEVSKALKQIR
ncbi:MAG: thioredoxin domain-containing protein, partial [Bacteroidota bacterium]